MRILIANRGEIARRIITTAHRLGHETVAVFADPDVDAPHVGEATMAYRLGPAALADSYLSIERLVEAAARTGADAVHPGYGFLSEHGGFARAVVAAGLVWVGPHPDIVDRMGSKITARRLATEAGVPVIPGHDGAQGDDDLAAAAAAIGYPVLIKAAAGGGGRGIRRVGDPSAFAAALSDARSEADRSFGDDAVIVERFIERPRHVEVQVVGDGHGTVLHLGTRECSVQRRYQKLLEEAPAPNLPDAARAGLHDAAVALAARVGYDSVGTVEFVVDGAAVDHDPSAWYFLEMNTRLQVEHPVTEAVTGLDLVELQLRAALGEPLGIAQDAIGFDGHAIEARINAEDPDDDFAPRTGRIHTIVVPHRGWGTPRWDSAVVAGSVVSPHYDAMIAKLVVAGSDRAEARRRLAGALDDLIIGGVATTAGFHRWLIDQQAFVDAELTTRFVDETPRPLLGDASTDAATVAAAACAADTEAQHSRAADPWHAIGAYRFTPHATRMPVGLRDGGGEMIDVDIGAAPAAADAAVPTPAVHIDRHERRVVVNLRGVSYAFDVVDRSERWAPVPGSAHGAADAVVAPFPAVVAEVAVTPGQTVDAGDPVVVIEAMKMLHTLAAAGVGTVDEIRAAPGDQVAADAILVTFVAPDAPHDPPPVESSPA